ncbi:MAG: hypothetical protein K2P81_08810 [Bacteriovoracaceae bacterium]|nr:hypothetical protein [Bacteriovoracaceae bacterium]
MESKIKVVTDSAKINQIIKLRGSLTSYIPAKNNLLPSAAPLLEGCREKRWIAVPIVASDYFASYESNDWVKLQSFFIYKKTKSLYILTYEDLKNGLPSLYEFNASRDSLEEIARDPDRFRFKSPCFLTTDDLSFSMILDWDIDYVLSERKTVEKFFCENLDEKCLQFEMEAKEVGIKDIEKLLSWYKISYGE